VRAYYMRLQAAGAEEAQALVEAFEQVGPAVLQQQDRVVLVLWPAVDADDPEEWDEQTYAELIFFLRAWTGHDPTRELIVLEDRPMEVPEEVFRRAS
jgi:hypothetical protein